MERVKAEVEISGMPPWLRTKKSGLGVSGVETRRSCEGG